MKLPIGFRFRPTDEELVVHYLRRKARSLPLPASVIPEFDVFHSDPWSLPGESSEKRYYFWRKKKKKKKKNDGSICKVSAATSRGYWKCNNSKGKGKHIVASSSATAERCGDDDRSTTGQVVVLGTRKTWTYYYYYYQGKHNTTTTTTAPASKTRWVLHEFHLPDQDEDEEHDSWVVCRVFQRKKNSPLRGSATPAGTITGATSPPLIPAASPCTSDITTEMEEEALPGHGNHSTKNDDQDDSASSSPPPTCSY